MARFRITKDFITPNDANSDDKITQASKYNTVSIESDDDNLQFEKKMTEKFRLYDDDGNLYFEGVSTDSNSQGAFAPLDDYGAAYGCTEIRYRRAGGVWEIL